MTSVWALDLGESEIAAVKIAADRRLPEISDFAFAPIAASPTGRGPAERRQALIDLTRRLHLKKTVVHVGGPGTASVIRDELLSQEDLDGTPETVRRHLLDLLPGDLSSREVRYEPGEKLEREDELVPYRLLSVPRDEVERSYGLMADAELSRAALHSGALALTTAAERLGPADGPFALLRIGRRVTVVSIHADGHVERFRVPTGEEDLAAAVAAARSIPTVEAYAQLTAGAEDPGAIDTARALSEPLDDLARDVLRLLEYHSDRHPDRTLLGVHPVGSVATRPLIAARLAAVPELGLRPLAFPPAGALRWTGRARTSGPEEAYPRLLGAIGVGLLGARPADDALVLRPLPPEPEKVRIGTYLVASALLLALVAVTWWVAASDRASLVELDRRQEDLALQLPTDKRSPRQLAADRRSVQRRLEILGRKVAMRRSLMAVDALFRKPREREIVLLESLRFDGETVRAVVRVRVPRGTDAAAAAEEHRRAVPGALREHVETTEAPHVEVVAGGYRLSVGWRVGEP